MTHEQIAALYQNEGFWRGVMSTRELMLKEHPELVASIGPGLVRAQNLWYLAMEGQAVERTVEFAEWRAVGLPRFTRYTDGDAT